MAALVIFKIWDITTIHFLQLLDTIIENFIVARIDETIVGFYGLVLSIQQIC